MSNLKFDLKEGSQEITVLEGKALDPKPPRVIIIKGVLEAPGQFLKNKELNYDPAKSHIEYSKSDNCIIFTGDDKSVYADIISGHLSTSDELAMFHINQDHKWSISDFRNFVRKTKFFFPNHDEHKELLSSLQKFNVNVSRTFENHNNNTGNSKYLIETEVNKLPFKNKFNLSVPLFKGYAKEVFSVEIGLDPTSTDVKLFLLSDEIFDLIEKRKEVYFKKALSPFEKFGCSIVEVL